MVAIGIILKKQSGKKTWHILTATGTLVCIISLFLMINPQAMVNGISHQKSSDGKEEVESEYHISEDKAMELVEQAMLSRNESAKVFVFKDSEIIENEYCLTLSVGNYSSDGEKYTALYNYAVSDSGLIYYIDVMQGADWILYQTN